MTAATVRHNSSPRLDADHLCNGCRVAPAVMHVTVHGVGPGDGEPEPTTVLCDDCARRVLETDALFELDVTARSWPL